MSPTKPKRRKPTLADQADRYKLYGQSVQEPDHEVTFFDQAYKEAYGSKPRLLREDFCGTFAVCCEWVKLGKQREAIGVDLDPEPLEWGRAHNLAKLSGHQQKRVKLLQQDVRRTDKVKADVLAAQNFSFWIFKTRQELLRYFKVAYANLARQGIIVADMMGGADCWLENNQDVRKVKSFKYIWDCVRFNPITHDCLFHIHFKFKDGSRLEEAFTYDWRFWTLPEVCELMREAGFRETKVYWEGEDGENWFATPTAPADACWLAYVVGVK